MIGTEHMSVTVNPFGTHVESGVYQGSDGHGINAGDAFEAGDSYLIHHNGTDYTPVEYTTADGVKKQQAFGPKGFGALFFLLQDFMDSTYSREYCSL